MERNDHAFLQQAPTCGDRGLPAAIIRVRRSLCRYKLLAHAGARTYGPSHRCAPPPGLPMAKRWNEKLKKRITARVQRLDANQLDWTEIAPDFRDPHRQGGHSEAMSGPRERGVVFISFEGQWVKLLNQKDVRAPSPIAMPSSSRRAPARTTLSTTCFRIFIGDEVFTLISNPHDAEVLPRVSSRLIVVPLYASSWVNPELYQPVPHAERPYDLIMVASWGKVKRHHVLFKALRSMPRDLRVLLVGQDQEGRSADTIRELAALVRRRRSRDNSEQSAVPRGDEVVLPGPGQRGVVEAGRLVRRGSGILVCRHAGGDFA